MRYVSLSFIFALGILNSSCSETKETVAVTTVAVEDSIEETATDTEEIIAENPDKMYSGIMRDYTAKEGCSFLIELDMDGEKKLFNPVHLDDEYKNEGMKVEVSFIYSKRPSECKAAQPIILTKIVG